MTQNDISITKGVTKMSKQKKNEYEIDPKKVLISRVLGLGVLAVGGYLVYKGIKGNSSVIESDNGDLVDNLVKMSKPEKVKINLSETGSITDLWKDGKCTNVLLEDLHVADIGQVGDDLKKYVDGVDENDKVEMLVGIFKDETKVETQF